MAAAVIRRLSAGVVPVAALFLLLLASLYMMSNATQNSEDFSRQYLWLLVLSILELVLLVALIGANVLRLVRQYRARATGSRLTMRLVVMFVLLALAPVSLVYMFSVDFLRRGIDSWFDVRFERALEDALELSQTVLDRRMRDLLRQTEDMARDVVGSTPSEANPVINDLRQQAGAEEMTLLTLGRRVVASSSSHPNYVVPPLPDDGVLLQVRQGHSYVGLDAIEDQGLSIRVVVAVPGPDRQILQVLFPVSERMGRLAGSVESAYSRYEQLAYLRDPLKFSFVLTLSLVLLLSLLAAVWAAFFAARRLVAPIRSLAIGTRAVAAGDYDKQLPLNSSDELGFLVQSFNDMTRKLAVARDQAQRSQGLAEGQRAYLEAVLGRLSSGVLALDKDLTLRTANAAAGHILGIEDAELVGQRLAALGIHHSHLRQFADNITHRLTSERREWREEMTLFGAGGRQVLMCRGAPLAGVGEMDAGHVIVFDDVTALIQAQRDAAWGEMARRLAHEIKNPLTPIQLSAERLRHRYLPTMAPADADLLDRATHTIIQQVEEMKEMVKAFSEYARTPKLTLRPVALNDLVQEVVDLYRGHAGVDMDLALDPQIPPLELDAGRFRQLLHNLLRNAVEAAGGRGTQAVTVTTRCVTEADFPLAELQVRDSGEGFPEDVLERVFEPSVTTKPRGSGLGLAIVKKIVEEHGGVIWARNMAVGGACVVIRLPLPEVMRPLQAVVGVGRSGEDKG